MHVTDMTIKNQRERREWLAKLAALVDVISTRTNATLPSQEEFNKAAGMSPRNNLARWVSPVSLHFVKDGEHEHMVVVMDGGDDRALAVDARCSCDLFATEVCAHVLTVLADHIGPLA